MKPTLFAETDRRYSARDLSLRAEAVDRILPIPCPLTQYIGDHEGQTECACEGRGWMWPDQPPETQPLSEVAYHIRLETIWTAMDILE